MEMCVTFLVALRMVVMVLGVMMVGDSGQSAHAMLHLVTIVHDLHALLACTLLELPLQRRVVMVLDVIVCSAGQVLGDLRPLVAVDFVEFEDLLIFFGGPLVLLNVWVQMVVPPK